MLSKLFGSSSRIYCDYAASTPLDKRVQKEMQQIEKMRVKRQVGNPLSLHYEGRNAYTLLEDARKKVAGLLSVKSSEIIFVGSATESDNLAIIGYCEELKREGRAYTDMHIITTEFEHVAVSQPILMLEDRGVMVTRISPTKNGIIKVEDFKNALNKNTVLVSVVFVESETGMTQPIQEIARIVQHYNKDIVFHTDAAQAGTFYDCTSHRLGVDMLTLDGLKIYGPSGVGILYKSRLISVTPLILGGNQEMGFRSGTPSLPSIVGFAKAYELVCAEREMIFNHTKNIRDTFLKLCRETIPQMILHGSYEFLAPHYAYIYIPSIDNEYLVARLDYRGISVGNGTACTEESHSLNAMYKKDEFLKRQGIRVTFGRYTTMHEVKTLVRAIQEEIKEYQKLCD